MGERKRDRERGYLSHMHETESDLYRGIRGMEKKKGINSIVSQYIS